MRLIYAKLLKTSLVTKVTLGVGSILVLAVAISTMISFRFSETLLLEQAAGSMKKALATHGDFLESAFDEVTNDAHLISRGAGVQYLIRAQRNQTGNFEQDPTYQVWQNNLERTFATLIRDKGYLQVRFIGLGDGGRELVRADASDVSGHPVVFRRGKDLQQKGHRDYFQNGAKLQPDKVYVSSINLNRELGKIQTPWQPTQRFVAPVFLDPVEGTSHQNPQQQREMVGLIVINTNADKMIQDLVRKAPFEIVLVDDQGGILYHRDESLCWRFEFDKNTRLPAIDANAWQLVLNNTLDFYLQDSRGHVHAITKVPLGDTGERFLGIILSPLRSEILSTLTQLQRRISLTGTISILSALFLSLLLVRHLVSPIKQLTSQAELLTAGKAEDIQLSHGQDEVGRLGMAFSDLVTQLQRRRKEADRQAAEVRDLNISLEEKVVQRTMELEKARQDAESANQSKSDFLANMSHEIRTPMTAILGYTDILNEQNLSEDERLCHVRTIKQNGNHLLTIINDILDVSKIESGKMETEKLPMAIWDILEDIRDLLSVKARDRGIELLVNFQYPLPETIIGDPVRLRQVLLNLVGNSIKFTENGEVRITVSLVKDKLRLAISDTGIGMSPEQTKLLFKPFTQADATTTRKFGGTGLGLTISKHLSELMGGGITLKSKLNRGSTFTVEIDPGDLSKTTLVDQQPRKSRSVVHPNKQDADSWFTGRVLLAEDTLVNQKLAERLLTKAGHKVEIANNGQEALDMALEQWRAGTPFELILMDMQMPLMDGYEAATRLRAVDYPLPIVALTANAMASDREKCLQAGCNDFATKPFQKDKLLQIISTWLEKSQGLTL